MISAGDFKNGITIEVEGNVFQIMEFQHVKPGKGAAFVRTKLKNIISGDNYYDYFPEEGGGGGGGVTPEEVRTIVSGMTDSEVSDVSTNPIQNNTIKEYVDSTKVTVDSAIDENSTNAIQNGVITKFVNSSIETSTATFRGTYTTIEALNAAAGDKNDYAFYSHTDAAGNTVFDRYKFVPTEQADLPEGYTQLEYIESSGTQYIDTGINPNRDTKFYLKFSPVEYHYGTYYFGTYGLSDRGYYDTFSLSADNAMVNLQVIGGDNFIDISVGDIAEISVEYPYYSVDGTTLTLPTVDAVTFSGTNTICLFTAKRDGGISTAFNSYMRLYACQIYENDGTTLAADYIPCKNASNMLGLYDLVNEIFLPNQGSDTFIAGPQANGYWSFEYSIPGNLFSSLQFAALNSGINSTKVAQIETNKNNISLLSEQVGYAISELQGVL